MSEPYPDTPDDFYRLVASLGEGDSLSPTPVLEALCQLEKHRRSYFEACVLYAEHPKSTHAKGLSTHTTAYSDSFAHTVEALRPETEVVDYVFTCISLLRHEDESRANFMNVILGSQTIKKLQFVQREEIRKGIEETISYQQVDEQSIKSQTAESISTTFLDGISADTSEFVSQLQNTKAARKLRIQGSIGTHALGILKTTLGVAGGILLAKRLQAKPK